MAYNGRYYAEKCALFNSTTYIADKSDKAAWKLPEASVIQKC